jgi:hypothetical protein
VIAWGGGVGRDRHSETTAKKCLSSAYYSLYELNHFKDTNLEFDRTFAGSERKHLVENRAKGSRNCKSARLFDRVDVRRGCLLDSDIPAWDGKSDNLFYSVSAKAESIDDL